MYGTKEFCGLEQISTLCEQPAASDSRAQEFELTPTDSSSTASSKTKFDFEKSNAGENNSSNCGSVASSPRGWGLEPPQLPATAPPAPPSPHGYKF